jgi:superfamily II DNA helicase RecQ
MEKKMQIEVFAVPAMGNREMVEAMNRFLRAHRVLHMEKKLVDKEGGCYWTFCVEYIEGPGPGPGVVGEGAPRVDYREVLTTAEFGRFSVLRVLRKEVAEREAVPAYAVFTNEQLAQMARMEQPTATAMEGIAGIGAAKMARYGAAFLKALGVPGKETANETSRPPAGTNR